MKKQWGFILVALLSMAFIVMGGCGGGGSGGGNTNPAGDGTAKYSISGTITSGGTALAGVTVSTSGGSATTDASGNYVISGLVNGSCTVTSVKTGYVFSPSSQSVTVNGANITGNNFTAIASTASTYSISGTITTGGIALAGATVSTSYGSAATNTSGNYKIIGLPNGSFTLTPAKTGYTFTPVSQTVTVNGANIAGQNFTAAATAPASYSISGTITSGGIALAGVTVSTTGGTATTDASGNYTISGLANGSFTLTPAKTGYTLTPAALSATVNGANLTGNNFTATVSSSGTTTGVIQLPKTGQTVSYAVGDDGALRKGVAWPTPRFLDNANGTVTDRLTGLIWLKNANCFSTQIWTDALAKATTLASGACGLSDGSTAGQWRLPNRNELMSLVDRSKSGPALPSGHPFASVQSNYYYWSSSSNVYTDNAWIVSMGNGYVNYGNKSYGDYVWPVRAGQ